MKKPKTPSPILLLLALDQNKIMTSQVPLLVSYSQNVIRPIFSFVADFWGDQFLKYEPESLEKLLVKEEEAGKLKEKVRNMLAGSANDSLHLLKLIDDIQCLGVAYHFEREIKQALENIYTAYLNCCSDDNFMDLNHVSLCFRLLRQQRLNISSDIFNTFKDEKGVFKESLATDVEGLLSLYEAAFLGVRGETVLDEALLFSTAHLEAFWKQESNTLSGMVAKALRRPLRKSLVRVNAPYFISIYKDLPSYDETLLRFAISDFNLLQSMHKNELSDLRKWVRDLDFRNRLPFARDRMVECFFWITALGFEPKFYLMRRILTKLLYLVSIMDDIYDSYGTFKELSLFTPVLKRWSRESMNDLPEYMKIYHQALMDCYEEIEEFMIKQGTIYRMFYAKEAVDKQVQAYFDEAEWCTKKYIPTMEEYLSVSMISIGYPLISIIWSVSMPGNAVTEEDFQWLFNRPKILEASALIARLMDDMVSNKRETEKEHVATAIECYTTQHGVTKEEAIHIFQSQVSEAWKDINQEFLKPSTVKTSLLAHFLFAAQSMDEIYKEEDGYTVVGKSVKDGISALFINPLSL